MDKIIRKPEEIVRDHVELFFVKKRALGLLYREGRVNKELEEEIKILQERVNNSTTSEEDRIRGRTEYYQLMRDLLNDRSRNRSKDDKHQTPQ